MQEKQECKEIRTRRSNLLGQDGLMEPEDLDNSGSIMRGSTSLLKKGNDVGLNQVQICRSLNNTESVKSAMMMAVNSVRAAACEGECRYVASENAKKMTMEIHVREEDIACKEKLEQILRKWQELMSCKAPQELAHQISEQCKACDDLIQSKKSLVELIRGELKVIDEDYHRMFRQQAKDVDMLVLSMGSQVVDLHNAHIDELSTIENDFLAQRKDLLLRAKLMHEVYLLSQERKVLQGALEYCMSSKAGVQRVVKSRDIGSGIA